MTPADQAPVATSTIRVRDVALAAVEALCATGPSSVSTREEQLLCDSASIVRAGGRTIGDALAACLHDPAPADRDLVWLADAIHLSQIELLAIAIAAAVDEHAVVGRVLAHVQAPVGGARPTLGLLASAFEGVFAAPATVAPTLLNGPAAKSGLLTVLNDTAPVPERPVAVPTPLCLALAGHDSQWPGATIGLGDLRIPLIDTIRAEAERHAGALKGDRRRALALRTGSPAEGRSVAAAIAAALRTRPAFIDTDKVSGFGPWLLLRELLPVLCYELAPGERRKLPPLPGYDGPVLAVCGPEGSIEVSGATVASWALPIPSQDDRRALWRIALAPAGESAASASGATFALADELAVEHRHGTGRIAHLGRLAHHHAALAGRALVERDDVLAAAWTGEGGGLDALAEPLRARVCDEAVVTPPSLRSDLDALILRCRAREDLAAGLGASASTRYRPGVRALFTGPSGTGKTLAAGWIATRLGLPLYRVDLASVTSKYIGETEKNLSELLARAEQAEVILLFDEADSLFGKRTEITDANDRFANAQTNYLLQRIENYDGIVILTSNSQARFDEAFSRRLDFVVDFPLPGPEERRALWKSHLGPRANVSAAELNQLAVLVDLNGGQIRNVVLTAAVHGRRAQREIQFADLIAGVEAELRKLGRQMPLELGARPKRS